MRGRDVVDQFHDQDRLADAGAAEEADLAALGIRADQVDDLDPRLKDLRCGQLILKSRRGAVDRPAFLRARSGHVVDRLTEQVEHAAETFLADRHRDRAARIQRVRSADEAVRGAHGDAAHDVVADLLRHFRRHDAVAVFDLDRIQQRRQLTFLEPDVKNGACDLHYLPDVFFAHFLTTIPKRIPLPSHYVSRFPSAGHRLPSDPATISVISCVMLDCLALL